MKLAADTLENIIPRKVTVPAKRITELPEKVLQFGAGMLLRGLPDYFIDKANRKGIFNGRIVVVKSTDRGDLSEFDKQDGLYTLCVRGIEDGKKIEENIINSSISRVLSAQNEWKQILECAHDGNIQVIISNTTEVGIKLVNEIIRLHPPVSFPGKLLAFLYERFIAFSGSDESGFVIIPTELIPGNGEKLESIILELAHFNGLEDAFIQWLKHYNYFCNSLVDRIVTGMPAPEIKSEIENELGYRDDLLILCEAYRLWAIEGNERLKKIISFAEADEGIIVSPDITIYRELKLRLLNATHTMSCGIAFLAGIGTVKEAMHDETMAAYIAALMKQEIGPAIPYEIQKETIRNYSEEVLDRFRNPYINHNWKNITLNYSSKIRLRCVPVIVNHFKINNTVPELFALGFAAYIYFMKAVQQNGSEFFGTLNGQQYLVDDEMAGKFYSLWQSLPANKVVGEVLKDSVLWGTDLNAFPGFQQSVANKLNHIIGEGMRATLESLAVKKIYVS